MVNKLCARDIMVDNVISVRPDQTLTQVWQTLVENRISGVPVVDRSGKLLGVISQTDLSREAYVGWAGGPERGTFFWGMPFIAEPGWGAMPAEMSTMLADEVMTRDPVTVAADDDIPTIAAMLRTHHIHRVLVTDKDRVVGIISSLDMLKILERH